MRGAGGAEAEAEVGAEETREREGLRVETGCDVAGLWTL